jgi:hypothetical protein
VVVCIALGVDVFRGGPCPPLYIRGDRVTWKVLAEYSWSLTTIQSGSFLCTVASSMPIQVVTKAVRYIYELSLTLEHSISISSPTVPGLTGLGVVPESCIILDHPTSLGRLYGSCLLMSPAFSWLADCTREFNVYLPCQLQVKLTGTPSAPHAR